MIIHYVAKNEIGDAWQIFRGFADKDWGFTDCTKKVIIDQLSIGQAFAFDHHFQQFGSVSVVPM